MVEKITEKAYGFEAIKTALRQTKDGISITLVIHPNDIPRDLINDSIGSRYMVGMGRLNDQDEIEETEAMREARQMVVSCGAFCRQFDFQQWLFENGHAEFMSEKGAAEAVRHLLKIKSRSELKDNEDAQQRWSILRGLYINRSIFKEEDLG